MDSSAAGRNGIPRGRETAENSILSEIVRVSGLDAEHGADQQLKYAEFLKIAIEYQDVEFSIDPIVTAMVHAVLGKLSGVDSTTNNQLVRLVANSIFENQETQFRMRRFWDSLVKTAKETRR